MLLKFRNITKNKLKNSRTRHFLKTISWRLIGSVDTLLIALFFTQNSEKSEQKALIIMLGDTFIKMILYYFHERVWYRISYGLKQGKPENKRHIAKAISWRIVGTLATIVLATAVTGNIKIGSSIASVELITKLVLYFFHEKLWVKINIKLNNET